MKALVVYDSAYGNTKTIAEAIGRGLGEDARVVQVGYVKPDELADYELLIVGSPTQAGRATPVIKQFIEGIPSANLKSNAGVAAFDTRIPAGQQGRVLRLFMAMLGYAAPRIARGLEKKGGRLVARPEGFFVKDKEGPLIEGEADRAVAWGATVAMEATART